jgi:hypothetical protein
MYVTVVHIHRAARHTSLVMLRGNGALRTIMSLIATASLMANWSAMAGWRIK